jgi:acyl dehydratase
VGLYFDDFTPAETVTSRGRTITEGDIVTFAGVSGDFSEIHMNEEWALGSMFGRRVAHGALVFSVSTGLTTQLRLVDEALLAFAGVDHLRFVQPVFIGDTVHVVKRVIERTPVDASRGVIVFETKVVNQRGDTVLMYHDKLLLKRQLPTPASPDA